LKIKNTRKTRYKTRGTMATIGKRVGVSKIFGLNLRD
jgi:NADH dehydrogenase FAD-containing subunit